MSGLIKDDLTVLQYYADNGMRERYWNYLANHQTNDKPDADKYGELALSVVRNDSMPGRIANNYAQNYVENHPIAGKKLLSEQQWEKVGVDLIREDLKQRQDLYAKNRPDLALNLPVESVYESHRKAFASNGIDAKAWTPAVLIDASIKNTGNTKEANQIWKEMLNSDKLGAERAVASLGRQQDNGELLSQYTVNQTKAYAEAVFDVPYNKTGVIRTTEMSANGQLDNHWYAKAGGTWREGHIAKSTFIALPYATEVSPAEAQQLDSIAEFRDQRNKLSLEENMHNLDRNRDITKSKQTFADNTQDRNSTLPRTDVNVLHALNTLQPTDPAPHVRPPGGYPIADWNERSKPIREYNQENGTSKLYTFNSDGFPIREQQLDVNGVDVTPKFNQNPSPQMNQSQEQSNQPQMKLSLSM
jgi:hypothetical protein